MRIPLQLGRRQMALARRQASNQAVDREDHIVRFDTHQRLQHFVMMSMFIILIFTGFPQRFSELGVSQWWVSTLGGLETVRTIHRLAGLVMLVDAVYHVCYLIHRIVIQRRLGALEMIPRPKDVADAYHMLRYFLRLSPERPKFGRFSYLEKFDYWAVFWGIAVIGASGLILFLPVLATKFLPGEALEVAHTVHGDEAILAVGWILLVHMFNAHLAPWVFPFNPSIFTGRLSREHYAEEHPLEYAHITMSEPAVASQPEGKPEGRTVSETDSSPSTTGPIPRPEGGP